MAKGRSPAQAKWESFVQPFRFFAYNNEVVWRFSEISPEVRRKGSLTGANDIWIAATALGKDQPLVTSHADDFAARGRPGSLVLLNPGVAPQRQNVAAASPATAVHRQQPTPRTAPQKRQEPIQSG